MAAAAGLSLVTNVSDYAAKNAQQPCFVIIVTLIIVQNCKDVVECSRSECNYKCGLDALFVPKDYAVIVPEKKVCPRPILNQNKWLKKENDRLKTEIRHLKDENRRLLASQGM
eukprot:scaffold1802_cov146-Skeletonema_dohrnii-CCMP3373.AAC.4